MMTVFSVWSFIFLTFSCWTCTAGCTWMKTRNRASLSSFQVSSNSSIHHLIQACKDVMHGHEKLSMEFPHKLYNHMLQLQGDNHVLFILGTLKNIMKIYRKKYDKVDCDQYKLQIFMLDVSRQIFELEQCAKNMVASEVEKQISKRMKMHFKRLISHLKKTDYSAEDCNEISGVVLKHLRRIDLLATKTKTDLQ